MTRGKRALKLVGETAREVGLLTLVFAPLDTLLEGRVVDPAVLAGVIMGAIGLIAWGIFEQTED